MSDKFRLRDAGPADTGTVLRYIVALAAYEKLAHEVEATEALLARHMFGAEAIAEAILAEIPDGAGGWKPAGFALFYRSFSTFAARPGLYLEDLYVDEAARGLGLGKALILAGAKRAQARGYARYHWQVLDWNSPARDFYKAMGAREMAEWINVRVDGEALAALAAKAES